MRNAKLLEELLLMKHLLVAATALSVGLIAKSESMFNEVISRIESASDPKGFIKNSKSFYSSQRILEVASGDIVVTTIFKDPNMYRVTTYSKGIPVRIKLIKGADVWTFSIETTEEEKPHVNLKKVTGDELSFALMQASLANPQITLSEAFADIVVTTRLVDGTLYYKLTATPKSKANGVVEIYADSKTFLKKAFVFKRKKAGVTLDVKMEIKAYHDIGGALVPQTTLIEAGDNSHILNLVEYKLNPQIDNSEFEVDSIVKQLKSLL